MSNVIERTTIITPKFQPNLPPSFSLVWSLASVASWGFMGLAAWYFSTHLSSPCFASQLLHEGGGSRKFLWFGKQETCLGGSESSIWNIIRCSLPEVLYLIRDYSYETCNIKNVDSDIAAVWTLVPFATAMLLAACNALFELFLILCGEPYQRKMTAFSETWNAISSALLGLTEATLINATLLLTLTPDQLALNLFFFHGNVILAAFYTPLLFFDRMWGTGLLMSVVEMVIFVVVLSRGCLSLNSSSWIAVGCLLRASTVLQRPQTPQDSVIFNSLYILALHCIYVSICVMLQYDISWPLIIEQYSFDEKWQGVSAVVVWMDVLSGVGLAFFISSKSRQACRSMVSYWIWTGVYAGFLFRPILLINPHKLSDVYQTEPPRKLVLFPYSENWKRGMPISLAIPSIPVAQLPQTATIYDKIYSVMKFGFNVITTIDVFFPQAQAGKPLRSKERMKVGELGDRYYPSTFFTLFPQLPDNGKQVMAAPSPLVAAYQRGEILPYVCQYGLGARFLLRCSETDKYPYFDIEEGKSNGDFLVLDFRHLENFEYKEDYEPYGGAVLFRVTKTPDRGNKLEVEWLMQPKIPVKIKFDKNNGTYRRAESILLSAILFSVVVGKHLTELHMAYNLLEVALHNAFDFSLNMNPREPLNIHPFRLLLYPHLFNHSLATELTVRHLVIEGAVLDQIWAMKYDSILNFMQNSYNTFEMGRDENVEERTRVMEKLLENPPPPSTNPNRPGLDFTCSLDGWELAYHRVFREYTDSMVDLMYESDADVQQDGPMRDFYHGIDSLFAVIPDRYANLQTKAGVSRFLCDTILHLSVGHQFYGTTGITGSCDPRIMTSQVPKDGGPLGVDEWRSFAFVSLATAEVDFCPLLQDPGNAIPGSSRRLKDVFGDATPIMHRRDNQTNDQLRSGMKLAWDRFQESLRALNDQWEHKGGGAVSEADINYMYFRPLPADVSTGPGY